MARAPTDIRSLARTHTKTAIRVLNRIMKDAEAPHAARVTAAQALLDRGWGKAPQFNTNSADEFNKVMDMTDEQILAELTQLRATGGTSDELAEAPHDPSQLH
jgi:hypothetical protein